jgi:hypothetical protein
MPRKTKTRTLSGDVASPPRPAVGVPYGEGERRLESQRRTPVPVKAGGLQVVQGGAAGGSPPATDRFSLAIAQAQQMAPPEKLLQMPTARPNEDLMTGFGRANVGPATDEALYELRALANAFPYADLLEFVSRAEQER